MNYRNIELLLLTGILFIYCLATYQRNFVWKDNYSLWTDCVKKSSGKYRPHNELGILYYKKNAYKRAIGEFVTALRLKPNFPDTHYNLGIVYQRTGHYDEAITHYRQALQRPHHVGIRHNNLGLRPYFADIHNNLGVCYFVKGWVDEAIGEFKQAIRIRPNHSDARYNLGIAHKRKGLDD